MTPAQFSKLYANLPIPERTMPIYIEAEHGAMSWNVVELEVEAGTELGKRALAFIGKL